MNEMFAELLAMTDRVERLVGDGHWVEASVVEAERQQLLARYVARSTDKDGLRVLLERNGRTLEVAHAQRAGLVGESQQMTRRRAGIAAYAAQRAEAGRRRLT